MKPSAKFIEVTDIDGRLALVSVGRIVAVYVEEDGTATFIELDKPFTMAVHDTVAEVRDKIKAAIKPITYGLSTEVGQSTIRREAPVDCISKIEAPQYDSLAGGIYATFVDANPA